MPDIHIHHVIFTRVEKMYSPHGQNGYQIIYQSSSLGTETTQIEKYIQCFQTNKQHMNRYQFFWTEKGQAVLTKSVSLLSPDPEVIDRDQRDAFLVHALIVSKEQFANVRNDPFALFEAAENMHLFAENVEQIVSYIRKVPPPEQIFVPIRKRASHLPDGWPNEELQKLHWLGEYAATMSEQKKSILMIAADPEEIFRLLSCLLILLPSDERATCTFDTFVDSCTPAVGVFWALGGTRHINNSSFVPMRLAEHKIASFKSAGDVSAYAAWFSYVLQTYADFSHVNEELYTAQVVAEAFSAKRALPDEPLDVEVLNTFHQVNSQAIDASVYRALTTLVDRHIAEAVANSLPSYLSPKTFLSIAAQGMIDKRIMAKILYYWIFNEQVDFKWWDDLLKFAERAEYAPLLLLTSVKARPPWPFMHYEKQHIQAVRTLLDAGKLPPVLDALLGMWQVTVPIASSTDVSPRRFELSDEEFQMVVNALLQNNAGDMLHTLFAQRVSQLQNRKIVLSLVKAVTTTQNVAPEFLQALYNHPLFSK